MTFLAEQFMQRAVELAQLGVGRTAPNPPVGAVLVHNGQVVGEGWHPAAGEPHAEIFALKSAGERARGADLYVTLEPCCHQGRTGPCTEAVLSAGVARVFVGAQDPNPLVAGKGLAALRSAGLEVVSGLLESECRRLIAPFAKQVKTGLPYVTYKAAMSLDGQTATSGGASQWISCPASRAMVHRLRDRVDAIAVGSGTVLADDPQLTTRMADGGRDPKRVIFDGRLRVSPQAAVFSQESTSGSILVTALGIADEALRPFRERGVDIVQVARQQGALDLRAALAGLSDRNIQHLLLEGGNVLAGAMLHAGLIDRVMLFIAPLLLGGHGRSLFAGDTVADLGAAFRLSALTVSRVDADILVEGEVGSCSQD